MRKAEVKKEEGVKDQEFDVSKAMDDLRTRVLVETVENWISKIIPKKDKEIGPNIRQMEED